jgi:hypothetical protein
MNKIHKHQYTKALSVILIMLFALSGCSSSKLIEPIIVKTSSINYNATDPTFDSTVKNSNGFYLAAENNESQLLINGKTTEIAVKEKATGVTWYSNPVDRQNDKIATSPMDTINSILTFRYMQTGLTNVKNPSGTIAASALLNSFQDSVFKNQYSFYKIKNGIRVNYQVGTKTDILCPTILSIARYKELTAKMSKDDLDTFNNYFLYFSLNRFKSDPTTKAIYEDTLPILKKRDVYLISSLAHIDSGAGPPGTYIMKKIQEVMIRIGYTQKDLDKDNKENLVVLKKSTDVYFSISVDYTLDGHDLLVNIPKDSLKYDDTIFHLTEITVLPYFGAAGTDKTGYIFVPDGSGALINLNNGKLTFPAYLKEVYGRDQNLHSKNTDDTEIYLPIYGIKQNNQAFLAVIEKGDGSCLINADISGRTSSYNYINPMFTLQNSGLNYSSIVSMGGLTYYQQKSLQSDIQIRYIFLHDDQASYTGMALRYQNYLLDNKLIKKQTFTDKIPLYIDAIGAITYNATFLGIPYKSQLSLTSYSQALDILKTLKSKGVDNVNLQYTAWCNGGFDNSVFDKADLISSLGSEKDFNNLADYTKKNNINFYPIADFAYTTETALFRFFDEKTQSARYLDNTVTYALIISRSLPQFGNSATVILSPLFYNDMINKFMNSFKRFNTSGIGLNTFGTDLSGDFKKDATTDRQMAENVIVQQLDKLQSNNYKLSIKGANAYTLKDANIVNNISAISSDDYLFDSSIPFYQIVLHGIVPYSSEPINMSSDYNMDVLRLIEAGTVPSFQWMYEDNSILKDTISNYYGINYIPWLDQAVALYKQVNDALADCQTSTITSHKMLQAGLYQTIYSNGTKVYVNYNDVAATDGSIIIKPKDYKVVKGGM